MAELNRFEKLSISARYWLLGIAQHNPEYYKCLDALQMCLVHHDGERNGGDPEAIHQLQIFHSLRTHHNHLKNPSVVYTLAFLHDIIEDPNKKTKKFVSPSDIKEKFGAVIEAKVLKLSKEILGQKNPAYNLDAIFEDEDTGPTKGGDRSDNVGSMDGVFKPERLARYVKETEEEFLPRLKLAARIFPFQEPVYESQKQNLNSRLILIKAKNNIFSEQITKSEDH